MRRAGGTLSRIVLGSFCLAIACGCQSAAEPRPEPRPGPSFSVSLIPVGSSTLTYGQTVSFWIYAAEDGFAHLYSIDPAGQVKVWAENLPVDSSAPIRYPRPGDHLLIRAGPPAGEERVILLVTEHVIPGFSGRKNEVSTIPATLPYDPPKFLHELEATTAAPANGAWAKAEVRMLIVKSIEPAI